MAFKRLFIPSAKPCRGRLRTAMTGRRISWHCSGGGIFEKPPFTLSVTVSASVTARGGSMKKAVFEGFNLAFGLGNQLFIAVLELIALSAAPDSGNLGSGGAAVNIVKTLNEHRK